MSRRTRAPLASGLFAAVVMVAAAIPAAAGPPQRAAGPPVGASPEGTVTLLTGDVVTVHGSRAHVRPGPGRADVRFAQRLDEHGDLHVLPTDVLGDVRSGVLDDRLFDVTALIRAGYDDRSTRVTPLIVTSTGPVVAGEPLPSIGGYAVKAPKDGAFWAGARAAGVAKVWLDGPVHATLDRSVPQIGAPRAWQSGHTGAGAKVAVLDTGVDPTHPDLAGAVVESRDFIGSPDADDHVGHGTHVAATITGSGRYQGVAPDSAVLNGKVLDDHGGGYESDIIAGMEWAVAAGADVVNMSLGSSMRTDGTDPMSQAVNRLTGAGALFVVSAGNSGPSEQSIGSPAAADLALTVGAVDRSDGLAEFSSRGPRWVDDAIKPDITAPGVDIVAAKARNGRIGTPAGDAHVALSGTSMSSPHVAGAAAILAAQHPDWPPARIKGALMASAKPNPDLTVHEQGAGRVDVAAAVTQSLTVEPASLSLGVTRWPHTDDQPIRREITYRNAGTSPVTLTPTADLRDPEGDPAPAGMVEVSPASLTLPAGGEAAVVVTVDTSQASPDGRYGGAVVATGGATPLRTPIGVTKEVESYDVKMTFLDHTGTPTPEYFFRFVDMSRPKAYLGHDPSGTVVARLPKGTFYVDAFIQTQETWQLTQVLEPSVTVTGPAEFVFDARAGKPLALSVDEPGAEAGYTEVFFRRTASWGQTGNGFIGFRPDDVLFAPSATTAPGAATFEVAGRLAQPDGGGTFVGSPYQYSVSWRHDGAVPERLDHAFHRRDLVKVKSLSSSAGPGTTGFRDRMAGGPLPLEITEYYTPGVDWYGDFLQMPEPQAFPPQSSQGTARPRRFTTGRTVSEKWNAAVFGPAFPAGPRADEWAGRLGDELSVSAPMFSDQDPNHFGFSDVTAAKTTLHRDGVLLAESPRDGYVTAVVPAGKGAYRVRTEAERSGVAELSTRVVADWSFTSEHVPGAEPAALPLLAVRFAPSLDARNRAAAGRPFTLPVYVQRNGETGAGGVAKPAVQVSFDDGTTWRPAPLVKVGQRWLAAVVHPAGAKFVSLKAQARDAAGNAVDQTIIRAYGLR
ncbi:S8 family serine peptidase [Saccharothrix sp. 6-C]|uniref:S8 family serine peptidase n=1 Tax=Saccharothrix sp. 6-C TaxID=2781735 RepID=UPI00191712BB|nr:S8 family serine peptidase [Saccharothrix sp. 6-C]QQQ73510.1 S8 family serine peptidase [Saccharothrix sp. 6-C]